MTNLYKCREVVIMDIPMHNPTLENSHNDSVIHSLDELKLPLCVVIKPHDNTLGGYFTLEIYSDRTALWMASNSIVGCILGAAICIIGLALGITASFENAWLAAVACIFIGMLDLIAIILPVFKKTLIVVRQNDLAIKPGALSNNVTYLDRTSSVSVEVKFNSYYSNNVKRYDVYLNDECISEILSEDDANKLANLLRTILSEAFSPEKVVIPDRLFNQKRKSISSVESSSDDVETKDEFIQMS